MLTVDEHDLIRRKHLVDGISRRAIAQELGHARNTVAHPIPPDCQLSKPRPNPIHRACEHIIDAWLVRTNTGIPSNARRVSASENVRVTQHRNLAFEMLRKLVNDEIKTRSRTILVRSRSFGENVNPGCRLAMRRTTNVSGESLGKTNIENFGSPEVRDYCTADLDLRWYPPLPQPVQPTARRRPSFQLR